MLDAMSMTQLAMDFDQIRLQSITHNVSNMNTPGYQRLIVENKRFSDAMTSNELTAELVPANTTSSFEQTQNMRDLALRGPGYFQVQTDQGFFFTRRGDFQVNKYGELCTVTGALVSGVNGSIKVGNHDFKVDPQGVVTIEDEPIAQLRVVQFSATAPLKYVGNGLFQSDTQPNAIPQEIKILQGYIERSNTNPIDEMTELMKTSRHFELLQKIMRASDGILSTAINQLGEGNV